MSILPWIVNFFLLCVCIILRRELERAEKCNERLAEKIYGEDDEILAPIDFDDAGQMR